MKKLLLVSLLLPLLVSCSGSVESPVIEITGFFIGDDIKDYSKDMASMPSLKVGDEMTVSLRLDGNGEDLNTFIVKEAAEQLGIKAVSYTHLDVYKRQPFIVSPFSGVNSMNVFRLPKIRSFLIDEFRKIIIGLVYPVPGKYSKSSPRDHVPFSFSMIS